MTIRSEIEDKIITYAEANNIPISIENMEFVKPTTGRWLEILFLNSASVSRNVSANGKRTTGMFQINCYAPRGNGMKAVEALAAAVVDLYPVVPKMELVSIEDPLNASAGFNVDAFICVPVTGRFRAEF